MEFNEKLFELRKASGLSQEEVANGLGVSRQSVSKWEAGQSTPEMEKLPGLSELFNVSLDYLIKPSEVDALSIKTLQLEGQQKELVKKLEEKLHRKNKLGFLAVSIITGVLVFLAGTMLAFNGLFTDGDPTVILRNNIGTVPALLFFVVCAVILANYIHGRRSRR